MATRETPEHASWRGMIERCITAHDSRWIDPDGRIAKRVIAAILPLIEV